METPIEIFNNTHIELTRIIKMGGEYYFNKRYFYIADIKNIEAYRYGIGKQKCTKIEFENDTWIKVSESYKSIRDTHKAWQKWLQDREKNEGN